MTFIDRLIFIILWLLVVICPLPFGSNKPLFWSFEALIMAALLTVWGLQALLKPATVNVSFKRTALIVLPFILCIGWALAQALVPAALLGLPANPLWATAAELTGRPTPLIISIHRMHSLEGIMRLITYAAVFWLSMQYTRYNKNGRYLLLGILFAAMLYTLYGLLMHFSHTEKVLLMDKTYAIGSVTATFINRNSYATYVGICLIAAFALMTRGFFRQSSSRRGFLLKLLQFISTKGLVYLQCIAVLCLALILSNSRAGIVSTLLGITVFFTILPFSPSMKKFRKFSLILILLVVGAMSYALNHFMSDETVYRFSRSDTDLAFRMQIYKETLSLIKEHPITGVGLGNYEAAFAKYQNSQMHDKVNLPSRVAKAHNTYLENAAELGIPGCTLLLLSFVSMVGLCLKGLIVRRQNFVFPAAGIAVTALIAIHSLFDFSMQIPAVAITYFAFMGVCVGESWSSQEDSAYAPV
ncbi:MAG: O-antigen ligase family protein [Proteobacteria bacterium]|nr:O-antigen ligase family protein [Pseudomonadota bacterium]